MDQITTKYVPWERGSFVLTANKSSILSKISFITFRVKHVKGMLSITPCGFVVTGFDTSLPADVVRTAFFRLFSSCGVIIYLKIEEDPSQPGLLKRSGFVCLAGEEAHNKAVGLDGSDLGGWNVAVQTLPPPMNMTNVTLDNIHVNVGWEGPPGYRWVDYNAEQRSRMLTVSLDEALFGVSRL
ncbi:unnamed protein product [Arabis nemorensis]|uniref:RRM domain-containing protein n=1 Tax=Arabis nemorensis TaxID=586526 RepID=A0A565BZ52_9BRAS|nr:unnamed protein product [Arabis nemorensis]